MNRRHSIWREGDNNGGGGEGAEMQLEAKMKTSLIILKSLNFKK